MRRRRRRAQNIVLKTHDKSEHPHLCKSCSYGCVIEGSGKEVTFCQEINKRIDFQVERCSSYYPQDSISLGAMREIAWTVETNRKGKIGFVSPDERRREEKKEKW